MSGVCGRPREPIRSYSEPIEWLFVSRSKLDALDHSKIEQLLPLVAPGLDRYLRIQTSLYRVNTAVDGDFQRVFSGFYRVRRNSAWRSSFFRLLESEKATPHAFDLVIRKLHSSTGRIEASFASKLVATVDPSQPVIDSIVLANVGMALPRAATTEERLARITQLHKRLRDVLTEFLTTADGKYLVRRFQDRYANVDLTPVKMLDFVLWKLRE